MVCSMQLLAQCSMTLCGHCSILCAVISLPPSPRFPSFEYCLKCLIRLTSNNFSRRYLSEAEIETWRKFVKITFCLDDVGISKEEALTLYITLQEWAARKEKLFARIRHRKEAITNFIQTLTPINPTTEPFMWSSEAEDHFLRLFCCHSSMLTVGQILSKIYSPSQYFNRNELYLKLDHLLTAVLEFLCQWNLSPSMEKFERKEILSDWAMQSANFKVESICFVTVSLIEINCKRKKHLIYANECLPLRRELCCIYLQHVAKLSKTNIKNKFNIEEPDISIKTNIERAILLCNEAIFKKEAMEMKKEVRRIQMEFDHGMLSLEIEEIEPKELEDGLLFIEKQALFTKQKGNFARKKYLKKQKKSTIQRETNQLLIYKNEDNFY